MANIRTRKTASGPRYDVKFTFNGKHRMKTFRTFEDAKAYKKKVEGEQLAGLVDDPKGGERLFGDFADSWLEPSARQGPAAHAGHQAGLPGSAAAPPQPRVRRDEAPPDHARNASASGTPGSASSPGTKRPRPTGCSGRS